MSTLEESVRGTVKFFAQDKGWGFLARDDGNGDVFVHANEFRRAEIESPAEGDAFVFDVEDAPKGKRAKNISRA